MTETNIALSPEQTEARDLTDHLREMLDDVDAKLEKTSKYLLPLLEAIRESTPISLEDGPSVSTAAETLYPEESYNAAFYRDALDLRKWGTVSYAQIVNSLDSTESDSPEETERKAAYRRLVLEGGQALGFIAHDAQEIHPGDDETLGIVDNELEPIEGDVDAIIIPGAAGLTNHKRLRDAIKNIESGKVKTDHIVMTACERPVTSKEKETLARAGFAIGSDERDITEYELCKAAIGDLTEGFVFSLEERPLDVEFEGGTETGKVLSGIVMIGDKKIGVDILSSPFDRTRTLADGKPAVRAITEETFIAALQLIDKRSGTLVVESHDTWAPCQEVIAQRVFGIEGGMDVIGTGPLNADRLTKKDDGSIEINKAGDVISELSKYPHVLTELRVAIENQLQKEAA